MAKYQSMELAAALSRAEWKEFLAQVEAGRHNPDLKALCRALASDFPEFAQSDEALYARAFPGSAYDNARLRVLRTYLKDALEDFLVQLELRHHPHERQRLLLASLTRRGSWALAERQLRGARPSAEAQPVRIEELEAAFATKQAELLVHVRQRARKQTFDYASLLLLNDQQRLYWRLRYLCVMHGDSGVNLALPALGVQESLRQADLLLDTMPPSNRIYYHLLCMFSGRDVFAHHTALDQLLRDWSHAIDKDERINVFGSIVNHHLKLDQGGMAGSLEAAFATYQEMHRQGLIFGMGLVSVHSARNAATIGARIGAVQWTIEFLEEVREKMEGEAAQNVHNYGMAYVRYIQGDYKAAKLHLQEVDHSDPYYRLSTDMLRLRIAFDAQDTEGFIGIIQTLRRHLHRKEIIRPSIREGVRNLLKAIFWIYQLQWHPGSAPMSLEEVKAAIAGFDSITTMDWVRRKLEALERRD